MDIDSSRIQELIDRPGESLSVELKRWIDPDHSEDIAKIVRAVLALRNHGGGYLVVGFDNHTLQPDKNKVPADVRSAFHLDKIQGLISRFASEPFEVAVELPEREGQSYPVIVVPPGVSFVLTVEHIGVLASIFSRIAPVTARGCPGAGGVFPLGLGG